MAERGAAPPPPFDTLATAKQMARTGAFDRPEVDALTEALVNSTESLASRNDVEMMENRLARQIAEQTTISTRWFAGILAAILGALLASLLSLFVTPQ